MHSFTLPLSLLLAAPYGLVSAVKFPIDIRTDFPSRSLSRRDSSSSTLPLTNTGNAEYIANLTIGGTTARVIIDTGSSDLWVNFPSTVPSTSSTGDSLSLDYAIGSASGNIVTATVQIGEDSVDDQAFLLVTDASSFGSNIHNDGYDGLLGLGPNEGSQIYKKLSGDSGDSLLDNVFKQSSNSSNNFITLLLNRHGDPGQNYTGYMTIAEYIPEFANVTTMPKNDVESVLKLLGSEQHWQVLTDKNNGIIGPDGQVIQYDSIVPKAPDGQLVAVIDSGFTFNQVPRSISDAIYGRVQGAVFNTTTEYWTIPCGQLLNVSVNLGGQNYPIHPLDTSDDNFSIPSENGTTMCIGSFQPITSAFSLLGNYDLILGMSFLRNVYAVMNYGNWITGDSSAPDPFIQLLPTTNVEAAHQDFVQVRLGGKDTTGDPQYALLPASEEQHSPETAEEKKEAYEEKILSHWPEIFVGCLAFVLILVGVVIWRCCCRKDRKRRYGCCGKRMKPDMAEKTTFGNIGKRDSYLPLQEGMSRNNASTMSFNHSTASLHSGYGDNRFAFPEPRV